MATARSQNFDDLRVLSFGSDAELLWLRDAVLHSAGFRVLTIANEEEAVSSVQHRQWDVLLLCYSSSFAVRQRISEAFRKSSPHGRIIAITNQKLDRPDFADDFVYGVEGPEVLIDAVRSS
jgi:DNA-binding NtrC family response regulator